MERLVFSPEHCRLLGLEPDEPVRLLTSGARTVLLQRVGGEASSALPWDRDLVLTADVRSFSLADILQLLHASAKSGFLFFESDDHAKSVYLHRGEVVFAASNQSFDRLGECLVRSGAITPDQFARATQAYQGTSQFGKLLVERGYLSSRELWNGVKLQVAEIVRSLFSYGAGTVHFWEGEVRPDNVVRLSLPTRRLIAMGLKRRDDLLKLLAWLEAPRVKVTAVEGNGAGLTGTERAMFEAIRSGSDFPEQCRIAGVEPLCGARTVQHLRLIDAVEVRRLTDGEGVTTPSLEGCDDDAVRDFVRTQVKLMAEFAAPIVAVEGGEGIRERLQAITDETANRYPELLSGIEIRPGGIIDPEELIRRALGYAGDREREVGLAVGELISYLEFELLNHPNIDDPSEFLEVLQELRSQV